MSRSLLPRLESRWLQVTAIAEAGESPRRKLGFLKGQFNVRKDFKAFAREEIDEMFFGNPDKLTSGKRKR